MIRRRLEVYEAETRPLVDYYDGQGLMVEVEGEGTPDQVYDRLRVAVKAGVA